LHLHDLRHTYASTLEEMDGVKEKLEKRAEAKKSK
jgi:hypothetical protein